MLIQKGTKVKTITSTDGFDFDARLNAFTDALDERGIEYEVELNPTAGLLAFVKYKVRKQVPETIKDEYDLAGEKHNCIECPFYVRPTDGRRKNTRCPHTNRLTSADMFCCEDFYTLLDKGDIQLINVDTDWKEGRYGTKDQS